MDSLSSTELSIHCEELDNSQLTTNKNSNQLIENNSECDPSTTTISAMPPTTNTSITMKTQVVPLVYIQNNSKVSFPAVSKTNSNVVVSNLPQFQVATLAPNGSKNNPIPITTIGMGTNQNLIFATRPHPLVIQKNTRNVSLIRPSPKVVSLLKPLNHDPNKINTTYHINNNLPHNLAHIPKRNDISFLNSNNTLVHTASPQQKFVLAPMPKMTTNRLPTTSTTNCVQPKLAILPMPVPNSEPIITKPKLYSSFTICEGKLIDNSANITVMCDNRSNENSLDLDSNSDENLVCDEIIDLDSPEKGDVSNKTYELSITEDSTGSQNDVRHSMIHSRPTDKGAPKYLKHGITLLKKNYNIPERRVDHPGFFKISNHLTSISDSNHVSVPKVTRSDSLVITVPPPTLEKERRRKSTLTCIREYDEMDEKPKPEKERRRKSTLTCMREYDEIEVTSNTFSKESCFSKAPYELKKLKLEESKKNLTSEVEIELIKEKPTMTVDDCDLQKVLTWDDGIGSLRGTNIRFIINEFNLIEYITSDEYKAIVEKRMAKAKEKMKATPSDFQEEMRCLECGCYGLSSDFINPKFCSYDCQIIFENKAKTKEKTEKIKKRKRDKKGKTDSDLLKTEKVDKQENEESEDDSVDNSSQDKFMSYPWACKKKGFSWSKYLEHLKAKPAPVKLFKDPFPYSRNGFRPGMKLEGVDPQHPSYFCVLSVAEVVGYRIRLHFDGYPDNYDFWCNADSMDIFPMGWCEKYGHVLQPPSGYTVKNFNWVQYLKLTKTTAAPKHLFFNRAGQAICPNGFRVGMKLEAVDRKNTALVCVASVRDMMDNRILVHFDSWDDIYDYWADPTSPYIHPVGWCDQYGHNLTPPNDYPNPESFSWEVYLKETKASPAPVRAFKQRPTCGFKRGMRLECVDRRVPQIIRVATVDDVKEHQIRIHFDGWPDRYSYWVDDDSPDIHPMGWCQKTGHPIEPPLTPDDVYDFLECPTVGCRGQGHIEGPKYTTHSTQKHCPYSDENLDVEKIIPDRLLSPDKNPEAVVPVSREPKECKIKPKIGRPPKHTRPEVKLDAAMETVVKELKEEENEDEEEAEDNEDEDEYKSPPGKKLCTKKYNKKLKDSPVASATVKKALSYIEHKNTLPVERESWERHSEFLKPYLKNDSNPWCWTSREVANFVSKVPDCSSYSGLFIKEKVDGEAMLLLSQKDIVSLLRFKVGPALKLYNSIVLLRQQLNKQMFT